MQERLRALGAAHNSHNTNYHLTCEPIRYAFPTVELPVNSCLPAAEVKHFASESETNPWVFPQTTEEPACLDAALLDVEDIDLVDDLTASPTLEECATELLKLLF